MTEGVCIGAGGGERHTPPPPASPSLPSTSPARGGGDGASLALLQCVSSYPTPPHLAALEGIPALAAQHPGLAIGYSDHTQSEATGAHAVALGARILEKHFTDDTSRPGPDHAASLTPDAFARYADAARAAFESRTPPPPTPPPAKRLLDIERDVRAVSRQSVVAVQDLAAGTTPSPGDLTFKRPGTGLEPFRLADALSRPLRLAARADTPLTPAHLGD
jgi:sialic acid synthase SpsE